MVKKLQLLKQSLDILDKIVRKIDEIDDLDYPNESIEEKIEKEEADSFNSSFKDELEEIAHTLETGDTPNAIPIPKSPPVMMGAKLQSVSKTPSPEKKEEKKEKIDPWDDSSDLFDDIRKNDVA